MARVKDSFAHVCDELLHHIGTREAPGATRVDRRDDRVPLVVRRRPMGRESDRRRGGPVQRHRPRRQSGHGYHLLCPSLRLTMALGTHTSSFRTLLPDVQPHRVSLSLSLSLSLPVCVCVCVCVCERECIVDESCSEYRNGSATYSLSSRLQL